MLDPRQLEPALTDQEKTLRDHFIGQYLKDFDPYQACLRMGFVPTYAEQWSRILFADGYVQRGIAHLTSVPSSGPEQEARDKALIETTLRKVMQRGSDSARVAAVREFRAMRGWGNDGDGEASEDLVEMFRRVAEQLPA